MIMNQQSISVKARPAFSDFFDFQLGIPNLQLHSSNIYLLPLPVEGEISNLSLEHKKFIFEKELALYEVQYDLNFPFEDALFDQFFEITWHGVVYCAEIKSL